eukprot:182480_1
MDILPIIKIKGKTNEKQIHIYKSKKIQKRTKKYENDVNKEVEKLKETLFNPIKPLFEMSNIEISDLVRFWLMNDKKHMDYNKLIMQSILENNINGVFIMQLMSKNINLKTTLNNLIGSLINDELMRKIVKKLSNLEYRQLSHMNSYMLAELIYNFQENEIQNKYTNKYSHIDGRWLVTTDN